MWLRAVPWHCFGVISNLSESKFLECAMYLKEKYFLSKFGIRPLTEPSSLLYIRWSKIILSSVVKVVLVNTSFVRSQFMPWKCAETRWRSRAQSAGRRLTRPSLRRRFGWRSSSSPVLDADALHSRCCARCVDTIRDTIYGAVWRNCKLLVVSNGLFMLTTSPADKSDNWRTRMSISTLMSFV